MKRIAVLLLALFLVMPVSAHSGGTDAYGGHYDRSTGEYHYHHGFPAHQHINGVCPYDFADRTGSNSGTGESSGADRAESGKSEGKSSENHIDLSWVLPLILPVGAGLFVLCVVAADKLEKRKWKKQWTMERKKLMAQYSRKTKNQIASECGMPAELEIGPDGLPKEAGASGWGRSMTFYVSRSGHVYHCRPDCDKRASIQEHADRLGDRVPCRKCRPSRPDLRWFWTYKSILSQLKRYEIKTAEQRLESRPGFFAKKKKK